MSLQRDLKPQNLLLSDNTPQAVLKIADFGFARHLQQQELANTLCGSPLYMAPEILKSQQYDAKADLWSVGTILYELVVGRPPYNGSNHIVLLQNIERHEARIPATIAKHLSPACIELIYSLLERNPVQRISFEEFFNHPFLAATTPLSATISGEALAADPQGTESGGVDIVLSTCLLHVTHCILKYTYGLSCHLCSACPVSSSQNAQTSYNFPCVHTHCGKTKHGSVIAQYQALSRCCSCCISSCCTAGLSRPVQRIAGQAANGPEDSLPFVLDDDAVAPAFQQPLPEQQPSHGAAFAAPEMHTNRPRYGHRSPASALAGSCLSCLNAYLLVRSCNTLEGMAAQMIQCSAVCITHTPLASGLPQHYQWNVCLPVVSVVSTVQ